MNTLTERETLLTALVVVPATYVWIVAEKTWIALTVAAAMYLLSAHFVPALTAHLKEHKEAYIQLFFSILDSVKEKIRARITRRA